MTSQNIYRVQRMNHV